MSGAYLGVQGVLSVAQGEDGDLGFRLKVNDPVNRDPGAGVLADFADAVDLLAAAARGDHLGGQEQVAGVVGAMRRAGCRNTDVCCGV